MVDKSTERVKNDPKGTHNVQAQTQNDHKGIKSDQNQRHNDQRQTQSVRREMKTTKTGHKMTTND